MYYFIQAIFFFISDIYLINYFYMAFALGLMQQSSLGTNAKGADLGPRGGNTLVYRLFISIMFFVQ